ncbi:2-dehydropantoate 2-reductase [Fredinandcohnia humi]
MKIGIIGGGSIGLLFAGYLARNNEVTIYSRTETQASILRSKGVTIEQNNTSNTYRVQATTSTNSVSDEEFMIIAVKQYVLEEVLLQLNDLDKIPTVLFLQNGMGHIDALDKLKNRTILLGVVEHGALKIDNARVLHTGIGKTKVALFRGDKDKADLLVRENTTTFPIELHSNWREILTSKLIVNAVINPLTALFKIKNGELIYNRYFYHSMEALYNEIISVIHPVTDNMWQQVCEICNNTAENKSSMLRDVEEGRKTEVEAILGYVINEAKRKNQKLILTPFLFEGIKGIEDRGKYNG